MLKIPANWLTAKYNPAPPASITMSGTVSPFPAKIAAVSARLKNRSLTLTAYVQKPEHAHQAGSYGTW